MSLFVLEIGSEELPARFLPTQEAELLARFTTALDEHGIEHGGVRVMSTPRRAVVFIDHIQPVQKEREEVITGPPARVAYGPDGAPSKALEGFVRTNGVSLADVFSVESDKGAYVAVRKRTGGAKVTDLLAEICPAIILAQPFAKRMRWGSNTLAYARPLRWILALMDDVVVSFSVGPVTSGRQTWGHRIHGKSGGKNDSIVWEVPSADAYLSLVREQGGVEPDAAVRRQAIIEGGNAQALKVQGGVLWKDGLLEEVQGLCEHPVPLLGNIDPVFLEVPREVLLTSMESHQKSFGVEGKDGALLPHFLTVLNLTPLDMEVVRKGWERVLRARLEDARFFWRSDLSESFDTWLQRLDTVIFLGPLGSMGDKTRRLEQLCAWLAEQCKQGDATVAMGAARAGRLSKADLVSGMVGEFDTLQGIMGGIYAERKGEDKTVAAALAEQYLPAGPDSPVPASLLGAFLSMADKADTMAGCFGLGMIPTGAADPHALRRCALGIARIILDHGLRLDVRELFHKALELYGQRQWKLTPGECLTKLEEFFAGRLRNYWTSHGADVLLVDAVINAGSNDVWSAAQRLAALEKLHAGPRYTEAVQTFKRVANIVRKQGEEGLSGNYQVTLLQEAPEKALAAALDVALPRFDALWKQDKFDDICGLLLELRPAVDGLFDGVMVMCEDKNLRDNRLNLLKALMDRMARFADFAALQV